MWLQSWLELWKSKSTRRGALQDRPARRRVGLRVEQLEDRCLPSSYSAANVTQLIADINAANKGGGTNTSTLTAATSSPYVLTAVDNTKDGPTGLPVISANKADNLTIIGNGDTIERSTASGTPFFRLFDVASGATLTLENLTLQDGLLYGGSGASAEGGAIYDQGTLVLSGVTVQDNGILAAAGANGKASKSGQPGANAQGGGIWSDGSLTLENGTAIENNSAVGGAGGGGGSTAGAGGNAFGGGLYVAGGAVNISSTTVSGNTARGGPTSGTFYSVLEATLRAEPHMWGLDRLPLQGSA